MFPFETEYQIRNRNFKNTNINPFPNKPRFFTYLQYRSFENTAGKGEIAHYEQFLLFSQCFLPVWRTFCRFNEIQNCCIKTLSVRTSQKFVVWERVKNYSSNPIYVVVTYKNCLDETILMSTHNIRFGGEFTD